MTYNSLSFHFTKGNKATLIKRHLAAVVILPALVFGCLSFSTPANATIPTIYTVTFFQNASPTDSVSAYQTGSTTQSLTLEKSLSVTFSKAGSTFAGWNTAQDGSGTTFEDGSSYSFAAQLALYAIWQSIPLDTLSFSANGGLGSVSSVSGLVGAALNIPGAGSMTRTGYVFDDWNSQAGGSGVPYGSGQQILLSNSETLYAQWSPNTYTLQFDAQGGSAVSDISYTVGQPALVLPTPVQSGYSFLGWSTSPVGSTMESSTVSPFLSETLYAQWSPNTYTLQFDAQGGSTVSDFNYVVGQPSLDLPTTTRVGYAFTGWFSAATSGTLIGGAGAAYRPLTSATLYSQWAPDSVVISFDLAGASGSAEALRGLFGQQVTLPSSTSMVRSGYRFTGWNTAVNGSGTAYLAGNTLTMSSSTTLFAQWAAVPTSRYFGAITFRDNTSYALTSTIQRRVLQLAQAVKRHGGVRVSLYGYATKSQSAALQHSLAWRRAFEVAKSLKVRLSALGLHKVTIVIAGEVLKANKTSSPRNEVEAFVR